MNIGVAVSFGLLSHSVRSLYMAHGLSATPCICWVLIKKLVSAQTVYSTFNFVYDFKLFVKISLMCM